MVNQNIKVKNIKWTESWKTPSVNPGHLPTEIDIPISKLALPTDSDAEETVSCIRDWLEKEHGCIVRGFEADLSCPNTSEDTDLFFVEAFGSYDNNNYRFPTAAKARAFIRAAIKEADDDDVSYTYVDANGNNTNSRGAFTSVTGTMEGYFQNWTIREWKESKGLAERLLNCVNADLERARIAEEEYAWTLQDNRATDYIERAKKNLKKLAAVSGEAKLPEYAVLISYSWGDPSAIRLFASCKEAEAYLKYISQQSYKEDMENEYESYFITHSDSMISIITPTKISDTPDITTYELVTDIEYTDLGEKPWAK